MPQGSNPYERPAGGSAGPPPKDNTGKTLLLVFGGLAVVGMLMCGGVAWYVYSGVQRAVTNLGTMIEKEAAAVAAPPDNPGVREANAVEFKSVLAAMHKDTAFEGTSPVERQRVTAAVKSLSDVLEIADDDAFRAMLDMPLFHEAVKNSGQLSVRATERFHEFTGTPPGTDGFPDVSCPYSGQLILKGIRKDNDRLIAHTFLARPDKFPRSIAWFFKDDGQNLKLYDWMTPYDMRPRSEYCAREFSSSLGLDLAYNNYIEYDFSELSALPKEEAAKQIKGLINQPYPEQLLTQVYYDLRAAAYLTDNYDLVSQLTEKMEAAGESTPRVAWMRVRRLEAMEKRAEALAQLEAYEKRFGIGPRTEQLRSMLLRDTGDATESTEAAIRRFALLPEFMAGSLVADLNEDQRNRVFKIAQNHPDPPGIALALASDLRYSHTELAGLILENIDTTADQSGDACAIRADIARQNGDIEVAAEQYMAAIRAAESPLQRQQWLRSWGYMLAHEGRGVEAIQNSVDPVATWKTIALDAYDVSNPERDEYAAALVELPVPTDPSAATQFKATRLFAQAGVLNRKRESVAAWQTLTESWQHYTALEPTAPEETESIIPWQVKTAIAATAVQAKQVTEGHRLLEAYQEGLASGALLSRCAELDDGSSLQAFAAAQQQASPGSPILRFTAALTALKNNRRKSGREGLIDFAKAARDWPTEIPAIAQLYRADRLLAQDAIITGKWKQLLRDLGPDQIYPSLLSILRNQNRQDEVAAILKHLSAHPGFDKAALFDEREEFLYHTWQWDELIALAMDCPEGTEPYTSYLFEAYLAKGQHQQAEKLLPEFVDEDERIDARLKLAACKGQREEVESLLREHDWTAEALDYPWIRKQVKAWDGFEKSFPQATALPVNSHCLCLLRKPVSLSRDSLTADLAGIAGLDATRLGESGDVELWQLITGPHRLLLAVGTTPYTAEPSELATWSAQDSTQFRSHTGSFAIIDDVRRNDSTPETERVIGRIAAAILGGSSKPDCVACGYFNRVSAFRFEFIGKLSTGQLDDLSFKQVTVTRKERKPSRRTNAQRSAREAALRKLIESDDRNVICAWSPADSQVRLRCELLAVSESGYMATVRFADEAPCPTWVRGRKWQVETVTLELPAETD